MKTVTILALILGTVVLTTSCNKEQFKPTNTTNPNKELDNTFTGSNYKISGFGDTVSKTEGNTRIARFKSESSSWTSNFRLNETNYDSLANVTGAQSIGFFYGYDGAQIMFAIDKDTTVILDVCLEGNSTGGQAILLEDAIISIQLFDSIDNATAGHPNLIIIGLNLMDDLIAQDGAEGFSISNAYMKADETDHADIVLRAYGSNDKELNGGITVTNGFKNCAVWIPGYHGPWPLFEWVHGYWVLCADFGTWIWDVAHSY